MIVGILRKDDEIAADTTVYQAILGNRPEREWAGDSRICDVLSDVELTAVGDLTAVIGPMSDSDRRQIALAQLLIDDPDLFLLDESTNHLDVEGMQWFAEYLVQRHFRLNNNLLSPSPTVEGV